MISQDGKLVDNIHQTVSLTGGGPFDCHAVFRAREVPSNEYKQVLFVVRRNVPDCMVCVGQNVRKCFVDAGRFFVFLFFSKRRGVYRKKIVPGVKIFFLGCASYNGEFAKQGVCRVETIRRLVCCFELLEPGKGPTL